ncbi:MAG: nucleotidyltransferase domain-containing protein [Lachnospiraceae bacterium]|jgi:Nucleotidyltransferase domain.|nr:nucleotidyltransferase domain-containing protein [Lachnospiraceae bacterium]MDE7308210.1 nucleotidyltransferase domain-containing protein [Lachnospiraceae bacterium]
MYQHHKDSLENMKKYFMEKDVIALIFGGSVAKGNERPDSDLDAMVVVSDEIYKEKKETNSTAETISGFCTYEGGYFDIKYMTKGFLQEAAEKGSEPARNAFVKAQVLFSHDPEIEEIVAKIPVFQKSEKEEKMMSFYADFWLNYYYFMKSCPIDGYMKLHAINEIIYSLYRIILQENEILFACNRRLEEQVTEISHQTAELTELGKRLAQTQEMNDADAFVQKFQEISSYVPTKDISKILSTYTKDFEQWWRVSRPNINEW